MHRSGNKQPVLPWGGLGLPPLLPLPTLLLLLDPAPAGREGRGQRWRSAGVGWAAGWRGVGRGSCGRESASPARRWGLWGVAAVAASQVRRVGAAAPAAALGGGGAPPPPPPPPPRPPPPPAAPPRRPRPPRPRPPPPQPAHAAATVRAFLAQGAHARAVPAARCSLGAKNGGPPYYATRLAVRPLRAACLVCSSSAQAMFSRAPELGRIELSGMPSCSAGRIH
jgi:hypothetical protein